MNNPGKPIYRFGMGKRDSLKVMKQKTPGPQYDVRGEFGEGVGTVKMNSKTKRTFNLSTNADVPGPGDYPNIPKEGYLSGEDKTVSYSLARSKRFKPEVKSTSPGPGEHGSIDFNTSGPSFTIYPKLEEANRYYSKSLFKSKPIEMKSTSKVYEKDDFMYELTRYTPYTTFGFGERSDFTRGKQRKKVRKVRNEDGEVVTQLYVDEEDSGPKMMVIPPPLKSLHGGHSFGNSTRDNLVVDTKDSQKVLYGLTGPGPKYAPEFKQVDKNVHSVKITSSDGTVKASRSFFKPGPGTYDPHQPGTEWIKKGKGAPLVGRETEVHDVFTNSTRKARFIQKQLGVFSPGPKYNIGKGLGEGGPAFSIPRAGNTRLKKERKRAERRRKIFEAKDPVLSASEFETDDFADLDLEDDDDAREGGIEVLQQAGSENVYNPQYQLVEKRSTEVAFGKSSRMPPTAMTDVPGPKYYPGLSHISSTRRAVVPRIVKSSESYGYSKYGNSPNSKGVDSPGVARYFPVKSTLGRRGTSFGGIKPMRKGRKNHNFGGRRMFGASSSNSSSEPSSPSPSSSRKNKRKGRRRKSKGSKSKGIGSRVGSNSSTFSSSNPSILQHSRGSSRSSRGSRSSSKRTSSSSSKRSGRRSGSRGSTL